VAVGIFALYMLLRQNGESASVSANNITRTCERDVDYWVVENFLQLNETAAFNGTQTRHVLQNYQ